MLSLVRFVQIPWVQTNTNFVRLYYWQHTWDPFCWLYYWCRKRSICCISLAVRQCCLQWLICTLSAVIDGIQIHCPLESELHFRAVVSWHTNLQGLCSHSQAVPQQCKFHIAQRLVVIHVTTSVTFLTKCRTFFLCVCCSTSATITTRCLFLMFVVCCMLWHWRSVAFWVTLL